MYAPRTIGDFAGPEPSLAQPRIRLNMPVRDFTLDWRRCNLVANYIAEYASYYFEQKDRAENLISSVFYELMDHLVSRSRDDTAVRVDFSHAGDWLVFEISFFMNPEQLGGLEELLKEINAPDIDSRYMELLENPAAKTGYDKAIGMIMIAHDYRARLSAVLREGEEPSVLRAYVRQEEITT